jgi:flagellar biosynthesis/type III secretory pathway chaperone
VDAGICREHLQKLISEESAQLRRLEELLEREHELLLANDVEELDRASVARQECFGALMRIEDERRQLCRMMNVPEGPEGLERLLGWCDPSRGLQRRWADCAELAGRCRALNDRNGALVAARLKKVEGMLEVLTGRAAQSGVYGRRGDYQIPGRSERVLATV